MAINLKRVYDETNKDDGTRVLVDRIWPRGVSKEKAELDEWFKEVGPSTELRKWFDHDPDKYDEFKKKYKQELKSGEQQEELDKLKKIVKNEKPVTLVFSAKDEKHNQAQVLKEILDHQ